MPPRASKARKFLADNLLTMLTILGVVAGTALGLTMRQFKPDLGWSPRQIMYMAFPGEMFLRMLKGLIVPLLVSSIVSAIGALDLSQSKKIGIRAILYYMTTTICAVILGIILVVTFRPGVGGTRKEGDTKSLGTMQDKLTVDTLLDLARNLFPENLVQATIFTYATKLTYVEKENYSEGEYRMNKSDIYTYGVGGQYSETTNVLGLVMFSILMGVALGTLKEKAKPLQDFFHMLSETMMIITGWVIWISPLGVFFLVTAKLMEITDLGALIGSLGLYFLTVLAGLFIHGLGTLSLIFFITTKELPFKYIAKMGQVMATAFGTASSSATMPMTIKWCDDMGLDSRVTRFVIPIGATINMDGTALYEAVAAIYIAQTRNVDLTFGKIVAVSLTATAASIGAAGIPQAGLVTMVMVLATVGLPADDVTFILAVDWLLDRFRTTINVVCDALGAMIVTHLSKNDIQKERWGPGENDRELASAQELEHLEKGPN